LPTPRTYNLYEDIESFMNMQEVLENSERKGDLSARASPASLPSFDLDSFVRDFGLSIDYEWVDQLPSTEVETTPHSDIGQSEADSPSVLPELYLADTSLRNIHVYRAEFFDLFNMGTRKFILYFSNINCYVSDLDQGSWIIYQAN
jgi:hypothetical protein